MLETYRNIDPVSRELVDEFVRTSDELNGWKFSEGSSGRCSRCFHALFQSITEFLSKVKQIKGPGVALVLQDQNGNFQFAGTVVYHKNEDEDLPGNWSYSFVFNPADAEGLKIYSSNSVEFRTTFEDIASKLYGIVMDPTQGVEPDESARAVVYSSLVESCVVAIKNWIDENSTSSTPVSTEIPGKCIIDAFLNDKGEKVSSITPSGEMKNLIKDDARIEEAKEAE